uniref:Uncharacterized protein n=1 Tax=Chromera velia CCMP2878 TaxID=1169474 RepID=A0A0G4GB94_9ALVE|eukprot:Cvel_21138.t1-p1 / transcript=Cvel_21138.t1 / gene=Cvel_21138 / organism=Chromera_velia_CCMP2878 / gene_product=hypothetical protein / transcript_product=hypothetical protein / location=Cvel_scaffold1959:23106-26700(+) / protein_length=529 / sequence_SO=supercontig / SO=protein_coding / is_pseudo=false
MGLSLQNVLSYAVNKKIRLYSWQLALIYWVVCLLGVSYVVVTVLLYHSYARFETVSGTFNPWIAQIQNVKGGQMSYCPTGSLTASLPESYDFYPLDNPKVGSGGFLYLDLKCKTDATLGEQVTVMGNEIQFTTLRQEILQGSPCVEPTQMDPTDLSTIRTSYADRRLDDGTTKCVTNYFMPGPENFLIYLIHSASVPFETDSNKLTGVPCTLHTANRDKTFEKGEVITLTVNELFEIAGEGEQALDAMNPQVVLCDIDVRLQQGVWGFMGSETEYDRATGRDKTVLTSGVRVRFVSSGTLGVFDASLFLQQLLNGWVGGLVLLLSAGVVVEALGKYIFKNFTELTEQKGPCDGDDTGRQLAMRSVSRVGANSRRVADVEKEKLQKRGNTKGEEGLSDKKRESPSNANRGDEAERGREMEKQEKGYGASMVEAEANHFQMSPFSPQENREEVLEAPEARTGGDKCSSMPPAVFEEGEENLGSDDMVSDLSLGMLPGVSVLPSVASKNKSRGRALRREREAGWGSRESLGV